MKTRKALSLFFCTVAFAASAATVSVDKAKFAAGSWALSDASLGVPHGRTVSGTTAYDVDGSTGFYAVALEGGGTLFLAADDEIGPVLAFTAESNPDLSKGSPLRDLLERDIKARRGVVAAAKELDKSMPNAAQNAVPSTSLQSSASAAAKAVWAALTVSVPTSASTDLDRATGASSDAALSYAAPRSALAVSDVRVDPLVQSQWSQEEVDDGYCYNYYTPSHYPCGCVATAAAQIMRYWNWPQGELAHYSNECTVDGDGQLLYTVGHPDDPNTVESQRIYDWGYMRLKPASYATGQEREAIGRLTSDIGVALGASYEFDGTGAMSIDVSKVFRAKFAYPSGVEFWNVNWESALQDGGGLHSRETRNKVIYACLDARLPVQLAIADGNGYNGHAVVCDGYGFVTIGDVETEFAHINMGWAGSGDVWYNIPDIDSIAGSTAGGGGVHFQIIKGATFNIATNAFGGLLTGRIIDDGEPVANAVVTAYKDADAVATCTTDEHGIYAFMLPANTSYDVRVVSADGVKSGALDHSVYIAETWEDADYVVYDINNVGNSWGNDIDIVIPHVRIVGENNYPSLNSALVAASTMENPIVEIFGPAKLKAPVTITTNVTIRTVPAASLSLADCEVVATDDTITKEGWVLQVADGVRVDFSNIVIRTEANAPVRINVFETGKVAFSGRVDLGTVVTHAADAFILAGPFEPVDDGLAVSCPVASGFGLQFGTYECSDEDAGTCVRLIANALDATLTGVASGGVLVWDRQPIDPSIAIAYATNDVFGIKYYSSVDLLFSDYTNGAEVVFLKDCPVNMFTNAVVVGKSMTIRSEADTPFVVTAGEAAGFTVQGEDTELVFTNIVFKRTGTPSTNFATVKGGASLVLASGATIADLQLAGTASAVYVDSSSDMEMTNKVTMLKGSVITNCVATRLATGRAGGVYLTGENSLFDFAGGLITGCVAGHNTGGGAVYAGKGATVAVSGSATAYGNKSKTYTRNIYVQSFESLILADELTGEVGVYCNGGTANGKSFATVDASTAAALASREHFYNDYSASLYAETSEDFTTLVWAAEPPGPKPVPEVDAEARLIVGSETNTYATVGDAFEAAGLSDARIELVANASLSANITVSSAIVFDGMGYTLSRAGDFYLAISGADASLTVTNIVIDGGSGEGRVLNVYGGSLVLEADTVISNVNGSANTMVAPIVVDQNGTLTMLPGSEISYCKNSFARWSGGPLAAGAVVATGNSCVRIYGGSIHHCSGSGAGGVYIGNTSCAYVQGDVEIRDNTSLSGEPSNLVVHDKSVLVLDDMLAGLIGYTEGVGGDTNVFGTIDSDFVASTTASNVAVSARCFRHDQTGAKGMVATNETEAILVWSSAVGDSTMFTNVVEGVTNIYEVVRIAGDDEPEVVVCEPFAFVAIEEVTPGTWKLTLTNGTEYCIYTLFGSADLKNWSEAGKKNPLAGGDISGEDRKFVFEVDDSSGTQFWKVEGEDGTK